MEQSEKKYPLINKKGNNELEKHLPLTYLVLFLIILSIDQIFVHKIRQLGGFYVCNSGISFSIHLPPLFLWLIPGSVIILLFIFSSKKTAYQCSLFMIGLIFIFSGAFSNILDRIFFGCVVDYIFIFKNFFPVFNLADCAISLGSLLIIIDLLSMNQQ